MKLKHLLCRRLSFVKLSLLGCLLGITGCEHPLSVYEPSNLALDTIQSTNREIDAARGATDIKPPPLDKNLQEAYERFGEERIEELDELSGKEQFLKESMELPVGLDGKPMKVVRMSLRRAIQLAVDNNLDLKIARVVPAISQAQLVQAQAVFDTTLFANFNWTKTDQPQQASVLGGNIVGTPTSVRQSGQLQTGLRKVLDTGGQFSLSTQLDYANNQTDQLTVTPDPARIVNVSLSLTQPLLRNFGSNVNRAQIALTRNTHARNSSNLHLQLLGTIGSTEQAYWNLVFARRQLAIQRQLFDLTVKTKDDVVAREGLDATPEHIARAYTFVALRKADVVSAEQRLRDALETLKREINDPEIPVASEIMIEPLDDPISVPVRVNLAEAITNALQKRPEVKQALLDIDDSSIRQMVADNQRLPVLNLVSTVTYSGMDDDVETAYTDDLARGNFIGYVLGLQFEQPIGNRSAEAAFQQTRLARRASVLRYQNTARDIIVNVKQAMTGMWSSYQLIAINRDARRWSAENLRQIQVRKDAGENLNPDFLLDLELNTQQRLATAQLGELQAVVNYNISLVNFYQSQGLLLERNNIEFRWPHDVFQR